MLKAILTMKSWGWEVYIYNSPQASKRYGQSEYVVHCISLYPETEDVESGLYVELDFTDPRVIEANNWCLEPFEL